MKAFIVFIVVVLARDTIANPILAVAETGASAQFRSEDNLGNYNFGYNEDHTSGGTFRREVGDSYGNVAGSYGLRDIDGRVRIVNYIANDDGFKADIQTNEPGVEPKDTADATFNKGESIVVETVAAPAPIVAIPAAEPVALKTEQVAVVDPVFPPVSAVPVAKTVAAPVSYTFPEPAAVPIAKSVAAPVTYAFPEPAAVPIAKSVAAPVTYAFPEPAAVPIAKSIAAPVAYTFPEPAAIPVAKTIATPVVSVAEPAALTYALPAAVPVAKTATTTITTEAKPFAYSFPPAAAVPVAKSSTTTITTEAKPVSYAFPAPAAVPVAKSSTTTITTEAKPVAYAFPAPAAVPVAKSVAVAAPAAVNYAFPAPAAVPVAKSSSLHYAAAPIATAPLAYAAAPTSKFAYSTEVRVNHPPAAYAVKTAEVKYAPTAISYAPALRYTINPHLNAFRYASPFYKSLYSPIVASFAGPVPYFNNIEYHGFPFVKK